MTRWICTTELDSRFPYAVGTLYVGRCRGLYPWLHRRPGVGGGRGRYLWIDSAAFNAWPKRKGSVSFRGRDRARSRERS